MARKRLNASRLDYLQAQAKKDQIYPPPHLDGTEVLAVDLELQEASNNFSRLMYRTGIPYDRITSIQFNAARLSFHDNRSLLGHIADGCELCGAREAGRPYRGANIALHACRAHAEAIPQLRLLPPAMLQAHAVRRSSNPLLFGCLHWLILCMPQRAPN